LILNYLKQLKLNLLKTCSRTKNYTPVNLNNFVLNVRWYRFETRALQRRKSKT